MSDIRIMDSGDREARLATVHDVQALRAEPRSGLHEAELRHELRLARQRTETLTWMVYDSLGLQTPIILGALIALVRPRRSIAR